MAVEHPAQASFEITHEKAPSESVIAGFSSFGLAGLTAVDYLTEQLELTQTGHITTRKLPSITPFGNGTPRHHTRLFSRPEGDVTVLVNELFVPVWAADPLSEAVLEWADASGVQEITILSGVPVPHGPEQHRTYYVATEDYQAAHLQNTTVEPMGSGFLDGVNASLVGRGIDSPLRVGVFLTPVHAPVPDVQAAIRLIDAVEHVFGLNIDTSALEGFAAEIEQYYRELAARLENVDRDHVAEDRMFM
ncbi:proteasome assembly chaperone family protein [Halorubrum sp. HHNYT27]|uniref:proteasome assembly chaperone family protein n=1 Tax=Halorubrum sp. HHNYT27 TaxID=3402275 RepID=UPI003EB82781